MNLRHHRKTRGSRQRTCLPDQPVQEKQQYFRLTVHFNSYSSIDDTKVIHISGVSSVIWCYSFDDLVCGASSRFRAVTEILPVLYACES